MKSAKFTYRGKFCVYSKRFQFPVQFPFNAYKSFTDAVPLWKRDSITHLVEQTRYLHYWLYFKAMCNVIYFI